MHIYEVRPRKDHRGVDLICDALAFRRLRNGEPNAISSAVDYAKFSQSLILEHHISPARVLFVLKSFVIEDADIFDVNFQFITGTSKKNVSERASRKYGDGNKDDGKDAELFHVQGVLQNSVAEFFSEVEFSRGRTSRTACA
jgi:hypothetical protein